MMNILDHILKTKKAEIDTAKSIRTFNDIQHEACLVTRSVVSFSEALNSSRTGVIAEFKRKSPSKGFIKKDADPGKIIKGYSENGATAISVLTDKYYFSGSLYDLAEARKITGIPLLRKDFIIDPYQVCEARIAGADVILLIAAALTPFQCADLAGFAASLGLEVLLELHDESELGHINPDVNVIGINNRNLATFITDTDVSRKMAGLLPTDVVRISESGISSPETVSDLRDHGFRGFLMGENFMKQPDPGKALGSFIKDLET
ncbi:MAG: indole-3-glycerol phosphate synthase TrpC [Bacteroidales bacterium]|jgi:indole-3-glycerol phosphate synthase|nr:indole-3-glycerol phosphate synthase TrpC [Bacteroidales bacterium]